MTPTPAQQKPVWWAQVVRVSLRVVLAAGLIGAVVKSSAETTPRAAEKPCDFYRPDKAEFAKRYPALQKLNLEHDVRMQKTLDGVPASDQMKVAGKVLEFQVAQWEHACKQVLSGEPVTSLGPYE